MMKKNDVDFGYKAIEFLSGFGPWLSPLVPAMLTYVDTTTFLTLGDGISASLRIAMGIIMSVVIEVIGLVAGHTLAKYNAYNKKLDKREKGKNKISLWPIFVAFSIYLISVVMLNVVLPWDHITPREGWTRLAIVSFTIPSIIIISTRSIHAEILKLKEAEAPKPRSVRIEQPKQKAIPKPQMNGHKSTPDLLREYISQNGISVHDIGQDGRYSPAEVAEQLGVPASTLRVALSREKSSI